MTKPVAVFPSLDFGAILFGPTLGIAIIEFVLERKKGLLARIANVKGQQSRCAAFLGFETKEAGCGADVNHRLTSKLDAADVLVEPATQIPMPPYFTEA